MSSANENRRLLASLCRWGGEGPLQVGEAGVTVCGERKASPTGGFSVKQLVSRQVRDCAPRETGLQCKTRWNVCRLRSPARKSQAGYVRRLPKTEAEGLAQARRPVSFLEGKMFTWQSGTEWTARAAALERHTPPPGNGKAGEKSERRTRARRVFFIPD